MCADPCVLDNSDKGLILVLKIVKSRLRQHYASMIANEKTAGNQS